MKTCGGGGGGEGVLMVVRAVILHLCTLVSFAALDTTCSSRLSLVIVVFALRSFSRVP